MEWGGNQERTIPLIQQHPALFREEGGGGKLEKTFREKVVLKACGRV